MAPKKVKKISLNEFLGDNAFGSWADEMDALPTAPAARTDEHPLRGADRFVRREDAVRVDRPPLPREDLPLPTQPPYTAFIGNLAFDLAEADLENFFSAFKTKSVKIIRDREEKPKGFGYIEFDDLDGLRDALSKTGTNVKNLSGRTIRVSVAEPPKERSNTSATEDNSKFEGPWRREGPLPDIPEKEYSRRRFDGSSPQERITDSSTDWRSARPRVSEPETVPFRRKGSGFSTPPNASSSADKEESWAIGSKFKPSDDAPGIRSGTARTRQDSKEGADEVDWRSTAKPRATGRNDGSSVTSTPPTPPMSRRKLELLPRSGNASSSPSPMSSPKMSPASSSTAARPSPFGAARPVDVSQRDKEVGERLEREREVVKERLSMSRTSSHGASERTVAKTIIPPQVNQKNFPSTSSTAPNVRPTLSFANVAANKESAKKSPEASEGTNDCTA